MRAPVAILASVVVALSVACGTTPREESRCEAVNDKLAECAGTNVRLDCKTASAEDIARLDDATERYSCSILGSALPVDGDPQSASCRVFGVGCVSSLTAPPERKPTRYPVVLVNGIDTSPLFRYSDRIVQIMVDKGGHDVHLATLPPYESPRRRAPELLARIREIRAKTGAEKVNLICHSLGGLDCRYLVSPGGLRWDVDAGEGELAALVASVTTIGTAHRGTRVADVLLGLAPDPERAKVVEDFTALVGDWFSSSALASDIHLRDALTALSIAEAPAFNAEIVDAPGVYYQSWAGFSVPLGVAPSGYEAKVDALCTTSDGTPGVVKFGKFDFMALPLVPFTNVVGTAASGEDEVVPNDGLAAIPSTKWGNFRGCIPADHMEQLGQRNIPDVNVQTGFDVARFYANVAGDLAERGF